MPGYKKNYLKIYFWQLLSFILNFVSLFIVTPMLTSMQDIFGIYSVCVSLNVFLNYADLGFIVAGKRYAAASVEIGDIYKEKRYVGTSMYIFSLFSLLLSLGIIVCVAYPDILISGISNNKDHLYIARKLLFISSFSIFVTITHKYVEFIYSLRLEEYKVHQIVILGNIIKIASVPIYFFNNRYDIVGYYFFSQIVMFLCYFYIIYKSKNIGYGLRSLNTAVRFDRQSFDTMKGLAFGGFGSTIAWVLFYELDTIAISAMLGVKMVAIYAVGLSVQAFVRSVNGIVYGPYNVRFYYFAGNNDADGARSFFIRLISFLDILLIPIVAISVFARPFIVAWVGEDYIDAAIIMQMLVFCYVFNCITNPCSSIIYAFNRPQELLIGSVMQPVIFWIGIATTIGIWGVHTFAAFKLLACIISALYCILVARRIIYFNVKKIVVTNFLIPLTIAVILCYLIYLLSQNYLVVTEKSSTLLLQVMVWMGTACLATFVVYLAFLKTFRYTLFNIIKSYNA